MTVGRPGRAGITGSHRLWAQRPAAPTRMIAKLVTHSCANISLTFVPTSVCRCWGSTLLLLSSHLNSQERLSRPHSPTPESRRHGIWEMEFPGSQPLGNVEREAMIARTQPGSCYGDRSIQGGPRLKPFPFWSSTPNQCSMHTYPLTVRSCSTPFSRSKEHGVVVKGKIKWKSAVRLKIMSVMLESLYCVESNSKNKTANEIRSQSQISAYS